MGKPKDKDFVESVEGLLFCVVGYLHPPDRYTAYLKYVPSPEGRWRRNETRYSRALEYYHVSQVEKTYDYLKEHHPLYIFSCPVRNIIVSSVPRKSVKKYYHPRDRLSSLLKDGPKDELEYKLIDLVTILCDLSGLKTVDLGITGSVLTSSHNPSFSDIDLTVYGRKASLRLKETILETRDENSMIKPYNASKKEEWSTSRTGRFPLDLRDLMDFAERRWNYGVFRDTYFSIHPVRTDGEITEEYGDNTYMRVGEVSGSATVADGSESIYLPAVYRVEDVVSDDAEATGVTEIVSYEGLFCNMFEEGEDVEFGGILERVEGKESHLRVVVGGAGSRPSFIKRLIR